MSNITVETAPASEAPRAWLVVLERILVVALIGFGVATLYVLADPWSHPGLGRMLLIQALSIGLIVLALVASAGVVVHQRPRQRNVSRFGLELTGLTALCLGALVMAMASVGSIGDSSSQNWSADVRLSAVAFRFEPAEIHATVGEPVTLRLENRDLVEHRLDVDALDIHVAMPPAQAVSVQVTASAPGVYPFYCSVPGHSFMVGTLTIHE